MDAGSGHEDPSSARNRGFENEFLRTRWTIESNSVLQQNLIEYLVIAILKLNLTGERESKIQISSW